jgi:anti-sigma-K factor RskA
MKHDTGDPFFENIPAYALGALEAEESRALEAHLEVCPACKAELDSYRKVGENLLLATPPQPPSAALRKQLQSHLPSAHKKARPRFAWSFSQIGLAAVILLLLVSSVFSILEVRSLRAQQALMSQQLQNSQTALAMLTYPGVTTVSLEGTGVVGTLLLDKDHKFALLTVWYLPELEADQTYQAWLIDPQGERTSGGTFNPELKQPFTSATIISPEKLANYTGLGVTVEPAGGSSQPTGERVFIVDF